MGGVWRVWEVLDECCGIIGVEKVVGEMRFSFLYGLGWFRIYICIYIYGGYIYVYIRPVIAIRIYIG